LSPWRRRRIPAAAFPQGDSDVGQSRRGRRTRPRRRAFREALRDGPVDFVPLDVRGLNADSRQHVPGALNLPHRQITAELMAAWPRRTLFAVSCAGPRCNGVTGWADDGFAFANGAEPGAFPGVSAA
jgi:hypothetical protein